MNSFRNILAGIAFGVFLAAVWFFVMAVAMGYALGVSARAVNMQSDGSYVGLECAFGGEFKLINESMGFSCE